MPFICSLCLLQCLFSQPYIAWQTCYSTNRDDLFFDAILTSKNKIACLGKFTGLDGIMAGQDSLYYPGSLMLFDSTANLLWMKNYGGIESDGYINSTILQHIREMPNQNFIIGGLSSSKDGDFPEGHGLYDFAILLVDSVGNKIWSKSIGGTGEEVFEAVLPTLDGGFIATGRTFSSNGDIPFHYGDGFSSDAIVFKLDSAGNLLWLKVLGGTGNEGGIANIAEISRGYYYFHISTNSNDNDLSISPIIGEKRWFIKMDSVGNIVDQNIMSAVTDLKKGSGESFINVNNQFVYAGTGNAESVLYPTAPEHASNEGAIAIFDTLLQIIEFKQWGGTGADVFKKIVADANGDYYVLGYSYSTDYDLPGNYNNGESNDFWLAKIDKDLNLIWSRNFGGSQPNGDLGGGAFIGNLVTINNKVYCFMSMALPETVPDFDITCGNPELFNYFDAWLVAFELPNDIPVVQSTTKINIYPNPNSGNFNINSDMLKQGCLMQIFSIDGKQIYRNTIPATNNPHNFNQTILTKGCYIIQLNNAFETAYGTIIVD